MLLPQPGKVLRSPKSAPTGKTQMRKRVEILSEVAKKVARPILYTAVLLSFIVFAWVLWQTYKADNFGLDKKTFWDWMELLLVPIGLAIAGYWFASIQKMTELEIAAKEREAERKIALEMQQQQALESYLSRITELILHGSLGAGARPEVSKTARTWTLNALRQLKAERNRQIFQFLQDAKILGKEGFNLEEADLHGVDLHGTSLFEVSLIGTDLSNADLSNADLRRAYLWSATLDGADLSGAIYNQRTNWPNGFDYVGAGAILQDDDPPYEDLL